MRPLIAIAILLLSLSDAAPEPEYSSFFVDYAHNSAPALVEIESAIDRADRLEIASLEPHELSAETIKPAAGVQTASLDLDTDITGSIENANITASPEDGDASPDTEAPNVSDGPAEPSLADVCNTLYTSAQDNDLPVTFFANLLWQESRLRDDIVSRKGAQGIAQFMPETAAENGLNNPFDPMQAIPASARFLRALRQQFGNLGFVAAAYNAGPRRVIEWLEHRAGLPRETRGYVQHVTGLSVDAWRKIAVDDAALTFVQPLPCRNLPAFANVEQEQTEQVRLEREKLAQEEAQLVTAEHNAAKHGAPKHAHEHVAREAHRVGRERHAAKREAVAHQPRGSREKRNSV